MAKSTNYQGIVHVLPRTLSLHVLEHLVFLMCAEIIDP